MAITVFVCTSVTGWFYSTDFEFTGDQPTWTAIGGGGAFTNNVRDAAADADPVDGGLYVLRLNENVYHREPPYDTGSWVLRLTTADVEAAVGSANVTHDTHVAANRTVSGRVYLVSHDVTNNQLVFCRSSDFGATWDFIPIPDTIEAGSDNPGVWASGDTIYVRWRYNDGTNHGFVSISTDNGDNWVTTAQLDTGGDTDLIVGVADDPTRVMTTGRRLTNPPLVNHVGTLVNSDASFTVLDYPVNTDSFYNESSHNLWIDPTDWSHQRWLGDSLLVTNDMWSSRSTGTTFGFTTRAINSHPSSLNYIMFGAVSPTSRDVLYVMDGESGTPASRADNIATISVVGGTVIIEYVFAPVSSVMGPRWQVI